MTAAARSVLAFTAPSATAAALHKELADVWLKAGALGAAIEALEELQLWESLVTTYMMAGARKFADKDHVSRWKRRNAALFVL
jgi:hypothetical protein